MLTMKGDFIMSKLKSRKRMATLSLALLFTLVSGAAFAFANGLLTLNGHVILNPNLVVVWSTPSLEFDAADSDRVVAVDLWYYEDFLGDFTLPSDQGAYFGEFAVGGDRFTDWDEHGDEEIINDASRAGEDSRFAELVISPDGQYARLRAELASPTDVVVATLLATNVGSVDALLDNIVVTGDDHDAVTITVAHGWDGYELDAGDDTSTPITITIGWGDATSADFFDGTGPIFDFQITLDYIFNTN